MSNGEPEPVFILFASCTLSILAYVLTSTLVPRLGPHFVAKGLRGADMLKKGFRRAKSDDPSSLVYLPEAMGVVAAAVYILLLSFFVPLPFLAHLLPPRHDASLDEPPVDLVFPHHSFATYLACLLSLLTATFLGFLDDLFDIRWRFKVPIPRTQVIASVPLLVTYAAGQGVTDVVLPRVFGVRKLFDIEHTNGVLRLGGFYYLYMSLLSTFCTNSINILAGINGVEVGQALVIAISIALNDLLYISFDLTSLSSVHTLLDASSPVVKHRWIVSFGLARGSQELADRHLFSLYFMLPLIGVCLGLLKHNWYASMIFFITHPYADGARYPARAFIGDTFCYFSGMAFAVVGILSHFSKTLALFFLPQAFNFVYSVPQVFGLVRCPRHRMPLLDETTGKLVNSWAILEKPPHPLVLGSLRLLERLKLLKLRRDNQGRVEAVTNLTLLNLLLVWAGPMREEDLTLLVLAVQAGGSALAFAIRYGGAGWFYDAARR